MKVFVLLGVSVSVYALTLDEAIEKTLKTHPDAKIAFLQYESAVEASKSANSALHPRIDANMAYYPTKTYVMPTNSVFSTKQNDGFHADVIGSYSLWDFGRSRDKMGAALHLQEGAQSTQKLTQAELIEHVWLQYYGVAYTALLIETADSSVRFYEGQFKQAHALYVNGLKTQADELRFKSSLMEAQERAASARSEYDKGRLALGLLVGSDALLSVKKEDLDERALSINPRALDLDTLRKELGENNPRLKMLRSSIQASKALSDAAHHEKYGNVMLAGSYGYDNSLSSYDSYQVGVLGTIPLYDGGKLSSEAQKSRISYTIAQKEFESAERELWQEVYGAYRDLKHSDETIQAKAEVIEATAQTLHLIQGRYAQGLATYVDVLESQSALDNTRAGLAQAKYQKIRAYAQMQKLLNQGCNNDVCK
ncbi:MAG: TolC family protein [Sulfuricurvum sp.]|nr:TolC family protein [Sulfuricurvum sp.]